MSRSEVERVFAGGSARGEMVALCFTSAHLALLAHMVVAHKFLDFSLIAMLFATGILSVGALSMNISTRNVLLLFICCVSTYYAATLLAAFAHNLDFIMRASITIAVTYVNVLRKNKEKGLYLVASVLTLNLLLYLFFSSLLLFP